MNEIQIKDWLGGINATVRGMLLREYDLQVDLPLLDQDVLEVILPNKIKIDVGWFPQHDPKGKFIIRIYKDDIRKPLSQPLNRSDPFAVAQSIQELARRYALNKPVLTSRSISESFAVWVTPAHAVSVT